MKRAVFLAMLAAGYALPVLAGHGTIQETDTQIIIEYYGDGIEKEDPAGTPEVTPQPQPSFTIPTAVPAVQQAQAGEKPDDADPAATEWQRDDTRLQKFEWTLEQRAAERKQTLERRRQQQAERQARKNRKPGGADNDE